MLWAHLGATRGRSPAHIPLRLADKLVPEETDNEEED
jgi:hypothetical protein